MTFKALKYHSKYGILSFIIFCVYILTAIAISAYDISRLLFDTAIDSIEISASVNIAIIWALIALNFIGTILGLVGIFQPRPKKTFSILGLVLNGVITFLFIANILL